MEMPLFVKVDRYEEIAKTVRMVRAKLDEAQKSLAHIHELKEQEDKEMESWSQEIERIQGKISAIEQSLQTSQ